MDRTLIKEALTLPGSIVTIMGWVHKIRDHGSLTFLVLRDRSEIIQVIAEDIEIPKLRLECIVKVTGKISINSRAPHGTELAANSIIIISETEYDMLPLQVNRDNLDTSMEAMLDNRVLSLRNQRIHSIFTLQQEIICVFQDFFRANGFTGIHTPKIVSEGTEGGSEVFPVKYFGKRVFLAQSPQFYKQMMVAAGYERVFEVGHAYRAELHNTARHLNEYVSLDVEIGFIENEEDIMDTENQFLIYLFKSLKERCAHELDMYSIELPDLGKIPRMTLKEARLIVKELYGKSSPAGNLDPEGEKLICEYSKEMLGSEFIFITKYPVKKRPVYAMPDTEDKSLTKSFDLLYKGLEITTGGQRIHSYSMLYDNMKSFGLKPEQFSFYLDTFKYGVPPHGGFAIGLERLTMKVLDLENIREASLFPRDMDRVSP